MDEPALSGAQRAYLRGIGQRLDAALKLGRDGLSPAFSAELERLLHAHELVKVRFLNADREERPAWCTRIEGVAHCQCVGAVGHTALFFRRNPDLGQRRVTLPA